MLVDQLPQEADADDVDFNLVFVFDFEAQLVVSGERILEVIVLDPGQFGLVLSALVGVVRPQHKMLFEVDVSVGGRHEEPAEDSPEQEPRQQDLISH